MPEPGDDLMLRLSDISVRFGGINALSGLSFDAVRGEVLGIIGPNGAGKTTLFDVISGVRAPNEGTVVLAGQDITSMSSTQRARHGLRRTFQRVQALGWLTVEDNVLAALEWPSGGGGFIADLAYFPTRRRRERRRRVDDVLERCFDRGAQGARRLVAHRCGPHGGTRARDRRRAEAPVARRAGVGARRDRDPASGRADPARQRVPRRQGDHRRRVIPAGPRRRTPRPPRPEESSPASLWRKT